MKSVIFLLGVVLCWAEAGAEESEERDPGLTLDMLLSKSEQTAMGLQKLTVKERERLRDYIVRMFVSGVEEGKRQAGSVQVPQVIESRIDGDFEGWEGETIVKLMNGQIWQQSEYYYQYHYAFMPDVLIYNSRGVYKMIVEGIGKGIGVTRLK